MIVLYLLLLSRLGLADDISACDYFRFEYTPALARDTQILDGQAIVSGVDSFIFQPQYQRIVHKNGVLSLETYSGYFPTSDGSEKDRTKLKAKLSQIQQFPEMTVTCTTEETLARYRNQWAAEAAKFRTEFANFPMPPDQNLVNPTPVDLLLNCNEYNVLAFVGFVGSLTKDNLVGALETLTKSEVLSKWISFYVFGSRSAFMVSVDMSSPRYLYDPYTDDLLGLYREYIETPGASMRCNTSHPPY